MTDFPRDDLIRMVNLPAAQIEFRAEDDADGRLGTLQGYAAVFNEETEIHGWEGDFRERIAPGAFRKSLEERGDKIKVLFNHGFDPSIGDKPLGKPSVQKEDARGLYVEVPLEDTSYNRDLVPLLKSGALDGMSFRFSVLREEEEDDGGALMLRTLKEIRLYEYGPVTFPAYEATTAGVRARDAYQAWRTQKISDNPDAARQGTSEESSDTPPIEAPVVDRKAAANKMLRIGRRAASHSDYVKETHEQEIA
jgi:hypothetical protein